jgi:hypothetical protein
MRRGSATTSRACALALAAGLFAASCGRVGYDLLPGSNGPGDGDGGTSGIGGAPGGALASRTDAGTGAASRSGAQSGGAATAATGGSTIASGATAGAAIDGSTTGGSRNEGGVTPADASPPEGGNRDAGACTTPVRAVTDYCTELPELPSAPVIDGKVDCGVTLLPITPENWGQTSPPDATASYAVAWRPDGIYFFVAVTDASLIPANPGDPTWYGDGVELYADSDGTYAAPPAYDNPGTRQITIAAPSDAQASVARAELWLVGNNGAHEDWTSTEFGAYRTPTGYAVEAFVTATDLGVTALSLAAGGNVGMDVGINVSFGSASTTGGSGHRLDQYFSHVDSSVSDGQPYRNVIGFCNPALLGP